MSTSISIFREELSGLLLFSFGKGGNVMNYGKAKEGLMQVLEAFKNGDIGEYVALSIFPPPNIPMSSWSITNRIIACLHGTQDARGYRQWEKIGRQVKKGSRAIYILAPKLLKKSRQKEEEEDLNYILTGFLSVPVFRIEDTEGDKIPYEVSEIPELPLMEVAQRIGVEVRAALPMQSILGSYSRKKKLITLHSSEAMVFFHELIHAVHDTFVDLSTLPKWHKEAVAELGAVVLGLMAGYDLRDISGQSYRYIEAYAKKADLDPIKTCLDVMGDVDRSLKVVFQ